MLVLSFQAGAHRYALPAAALIEVLPWVALKPVPNLPPEIAGLLNFRGRVAPVIDLNQLLLGAACPFLMSSRILLTHYPLPDGRKRILGLRVERASGTQAVPAEEWVSSPVQTPPWLGKVVIQGGDIVQLVQPEALLGDRVRHLLFPLEAEPTAIKADHAHSAAG
jgi:chemotaxis-related protein WspB